MSILGLINLLDFILALLTLLDLILAFLAFNFYLFLIISNNKIYTSKFFISNLFIGKLIKKGIGIGLY